MNSAVNISFYMDKICGFSIVLWMYMHVSYCKTFKYKILKKYKYT